MKRVKAGVAVASSGALQVALGVLLVALGACAEEDGASSAVGQEDKTLSKIARAARAGDVATVRTELRREGAVELRDAEERPPLHHAAAAGQLEIIDLLLDAGADVEARARYDMRALHWAALAGELEAARRLLDRGALVEAANLYGMTALHLAATAELSTLLCDRGAMLETRDVRGMTPLHFARTLDVAKVLMDRGADVNAKNRRGRTPMEMTGVADCTPHGLLVYPEREIVRLRGERAELQLLVWNVSGRTMAPLRIDVESDAAEGQARHAPFERLRVAQMTQVFVDLTQKPDVAEAKHPLSLVFTAGAEDTVATCALLADTRPGLTPEDRGMLPVGTVTVRQAPAWPQYLVFATVPVGVLAAWGLWRWRERRGARGA